MSRFLFAFVAFAVMPVQISAQEIRKTLKGKVSGYANNTSGIYVINIASEENVRTGENGYFEIAAKVGDTLMFSSTQFKGVKLGIDEEKIAKDLLLVKMEPVMNQLQEVKVFQYTGIDAVSLGIIPKGQKKYTPAERKLRTATGYDAQFGLNTSMSLDPVFNMFSGRSAELRKNVAIEKKERLLMQIESIYDPEYYVQKLKIPREHVKGFEYYIVENPRFVAALNAKNNSMATFLIGELAVKYLQIIANEK